MVESIPSPDSSMTEPSPELDCTAVLETLDQGLVVCDRHQTITLINAAARRLLGLGAGELTAAGLTEAVSIYIPGDRTPLPSDRLPLWRGLGGETLGDLELAIVHPGGDRYLVLANSHPLLDNRGQPLGAVMGLYDITQRYRAETALRASNQGLRTQAQQRMEDLQAVNLQLQQAEATLRLFYDLPFLGMGIIAADAQTWVRFNDYLCDMLGYSRDEMQQQIWTDLTHPDDRPLALDQVAQLSASTVDSSVLETRFVRKDGLIVYTSLEIRVILKDDGSTDFFVTTIKDITERKLAETALMESESRFRATFEQAAVGIAHVAPDGLLLWLNPALGEILGYPQYELIGESFQETIYPDDRADNQRYLDGMLQGQRQSYSWQQRHLCQDGRSIWANLTVSLVRDSMQQPKYFIVVLQDITLAKQAETTLQQYAHRLRGLHDMDRAILTNFEPQDIAQSALLLLSQLLSCPQGIVALFNQDIRLGEILANTSGSTPTAAPLFPHRLVLPIEDFVLAQSAPPTSVFRVQSPEQLTSPPAILQRFTATPVQSVMAIPLVANGDVIGEITLTSPHPAHFSNDHEEIAREVADHLAIALQNARLFEQVRHDRARLHALSSQLLEAQETERRFLAHELHDEVGQALTAVKLNLHRLDRIADNPKASEPLQDCLSIVDGALQQVRNLSLDLRPSMLDDLGLVPALRWYINRHADRTGLQVTLVCDPPPEGLPTSTETACFRIVQEALTNIARHAQAQTVTITLEQTDRTLHLSIQDDGVGFDLEAIGRAKTEGTSLGLLGMEERGLLIGGQLTITSAPGEGTQISLRVPIRD
ncbi:PAS domain S-box protein [Leptolyngbya sp. CCNP1308]|uniref:sensor histidine kinase n=1 Tax=Leptolyngbya sp. CCNP1308 TaxID=3110255 RepID=UPI002B1E949A|nr:PAS domain S-box protein [Leptolyngbya sp. CCNP1308]MEA5451615.1 PAS domain S-box protein [Leptolyngbya sp. CCNP1308]